MSHAAHSCPACERPVTYGPMTEFDGVLRIWHWTCLPRGTRMAECARRVAL